jgi:translation initiation factor IF-1
MAKQSAIEQDGSIIEALSNAMFRVELKWTYQLLIYLEKCVCITSIITW